MDEKRQYEIANLSARDSLQLADLEKQIQKQTGEEIVLIAYQKKSGEEPSFH